MDKSPFDTTDLEKEIQECGGTCERNCTPCNIVTNLIDERQRLKAEVEKIIDEVYNNPYHDWKYELKKRLFGNES